MSLEKAIEENTAAVRELIAALRGAPVVHVTPVVEKVLQPEAPAGAAVEKAIEKVAEKSAPGEITMVDAAAIAKAATALVQKKGRVIAEAVLAKHKLKKFSAAEPKQYAQLYADIIAAQEAA